jgi:hypothetical protein
MARIVVNPHRDTESVIRHEQSKGKILNNRGEILICNEPGNEGVYVLNSRHELVKVGTNLSTATSAITKEYIDQRIVELMSGYSGTSIDENVVRQIANDSVNTAIEELIDNADERYNTLGKISEWIINNSGSDVTWVIDSISALTENITNIENDVSGITENMSGLDNRVGYLEGVVSGKSTDHFVMTLSQYQELLTNGIVNVDKYGTITYNDDHFYCIYEDDTPQPTPSSGTIIMSGDTISFDANYPYENGEVPSLYIGEIETSGNGVVQVDWLIDNGNDDSQTEDVDIEGDRISISNAVYNSGELNIGTINDNKYGIVDVPWEI